MRTSEPGTNDSVFRGGRGSVGRLLSAAAGSVLLTACAAGGGASSSTAESATPGLLADPLVAQGTATALHVQADRAQDAQIRALIEAARQSARETARTEAAVLAAEAREARAAPAASDSGRPAVPTGAGEEDGSAVAGPSAEVPSADGSSESWEDRIADVLSTEHPRPATEPTVDPEHQEAVEDSATESRKELTCEECS
jgi:hypothetical protein